MMEEIKMKRCIIMMSMAFFSFEGLAESQSSFIGPQEIEKKSLQRLHQVGPLKFDQMTISEDATVIGPMKGKNGKFKTLNVTGSLKCDGLEANSLKVVGLTKLEKAKISGEVDVVGAFEAEKSHFQDVKITSQEAEFEDSQIKSIAIRKNQGDTTNQPQILKLEGKTTVEGPITFESGIGVVEIGKHVVLKGEVIGGQIKKS